MNVKSALRGMMLATVEGAPARGGARALTQSASHGTSEHLRAGAALLRVAHRLTAILLCALMGTAASAQVVDAFLASPADAVGQRLARAISKIPLQFEANVGQAHPSVRFIAQGPHHQLILGPNAALVHFASSTSPRGESLQLRWLGADADADITGERPLSATSNYFTGTSVQTDVPHIAQVRVRSLYPGIDLVYYGNQRQLEYDLVVAPGADPSVIEFALDGASAITLDPSGDLVLQTSAGVVRHQRPRLYQEIGGHRREIDGHYVRRDAGAFGIAVASYDADETLVIDPVLSYADHIGGYGNGTAIAVDAAGNAYVAGWVAQSAGGGFPVVGGYDGSLGHGDTDAFVQKYNPSGTALIYSTYLGGSRGVDKAVAIAIDRGGSAYVTGTTSSTDFPVTASAYQATGSGGGFVTKLSPAGNALIYSTYIRNATPTSIALDAANNVYIGGAASSAFASTPGAFQLASHSPSRTNGFVLKLNATGTGAVYSTFLGGSGSDQINGIALDATANVYATGSTTSSDFPVASAWRFDLAGGTDAFVTKLNPSGNGLAYSTYLGGTQNDSANAIAVDAAGSAYVTGTTASFDFPTRVPFQPIKGGIRTVNEIDNAFVTKLDASGNELVYSSFLGGEGCIDASGLPQCLLYTRPVDSGTSIVVDPQGHAYIGGGTTSILFPRIDSNGGPVSANGAAGFVAKVSITGTSLLYSTLLGGAAGDSYDSVIGLGLDGAGNLYGVTNYSAFPTTTSMATKTGNVVFKLAAPTKTVALATSANPVGSGDNVVVTANVSGASNAGPTGLITFMAGDLQLDTVPVAGGVTMITRRLPVGVHAFTAIYRDGVEEAESNQFYQVVNPVNACN